MKIITLEGGSAKPVEIINNDASNPTNALILSKTGDETFQSPRVDVSTHTLQTIEYEHHEIHAGSHFSIADYDTSVASAETLEFVVVTPNTAKWAHMVFQFASTLGATLEVFEGSSAVVGGTPVTPLNNNRNSSTESVLTVIKEPTSITDGTRIAGFMAGAGRTAGFSTRDKEFILKQNTTYLFRFTSLANSNAWSFVGEWYEHTNKSA